MSEHFFELVQVHECGGHAEVVIRDWNRRVVYAGNLEKMKSPGEYFPPGRKFDAAKMVGELAQKDSDQH